MAEKSPLADVALPVSSLTAALPHLRRPFTAEAVKWKVQTGTLVVPHIDARLVIERLNHVVGAKWSAEYEPTGKSLWCNLTIDGVTRRDIGSNYEGKGLVSDSLKRAAVHFGVGVSLYALKKLWLEKDTGHLKEDGKTKSNKAKYALTRDGDLYLRETYASWLPGIEEKFGPVLDHGDYAEAIGDPEADTPADDTPAVPDEPKPLEDDAAKALVEAAKSSFESLSATQKSDAGLTKAAFNRKVAGAAHSHDDLRALVEEMGKLNA